MIAFLSLFLDKRKVHAIYLSPQGYCPGVTNWSFTNVNGMSHSGK
mgnify:CR=1 FL=1|jgi:hypothetical protein